MLAASPEALAHELGKPLLVVDHAQLQSAWVGETEKNMARIFRDAMDADAIRRYRPGSRPDLLSIALFSQSCHFAT